MIVIFGAAVRPDGSPSPALRNRVEAALRHSESLSDPLFMPTGAKGRHGDAEAAVMARLLRQHGVGADRIIVEDAGTDTLSSVRAVRRLMQAHGLRGRVYAATNRYHLPRCLVLLWLAGYHARPCPPPPPPARRRWYWRLREIPALPYDAALLIALRVAGRL